MNDILFTPIRLNQLELLIQNSVEKALKAIAPQTIENPDKLLTIEAGGEFLHLTRASIYSKVSRGEIPHMKRGKRLYFSTEELTEYLKAGRVKTREEIEAETETYLKKRGGRKRKPPQFICIKDRTKINSAFRKSKPYFNIY